MHLVVENVKHAGTGGVSPADVGLGFRPAFLDTATFTIYPSRFADGRPAPFHLLDGLPDEVVIARELPSGRVVAAKSTIVSGFERGGFFYTRSAAARARQEWGVPKG